MIPESKVDEIIKKNFAGLDMNESPRTYANIRRAMKDYGELVFAECTNNQTDK